MGFVTTGGYGADGSEDVGRSWARRGNERRGYLKECRYCGALIYMLPKWDGGWLPIESTVAGNAAEGEIVPHDCS